MAQRWQEAPYADQAEATPRWQEAPIAEEEADGVPTPKGPARSSLLQTTPMLALGKLKRTITGEEDIAPYQEGMKSVQFSGATPLQQLKLATGFMLNAKPEARIDMIRKTLPEAQISRDMRGNVLVEYKGETAFLNRPGADIRDVEDISGDVLKFLPAGKVASVPGNLGGRVLAGGAASGATQAASDVASGAFGSEQGVDPLGVALATGGGAGGELLGGAIKRWTRPAREAMSEADRLGLNLTGTPGEQVSQISNVGRQAAIEKGSALPAVQAALQSTRKAEKQASDALYEAARNMDARVPIPEVKVLADSARKRLTDEGFDIGALPGVAKRLQELEQASGAPYAREAKLKAMEQWRQRITAMSPKDGSPEQAAATVLKRQYDSWLTNQFNNDMILGDAKAVQAWRDAKEAYTAFKQTFDANKVIRDLSRKTDLTQEQMRGWLFNANAIGAKREAGALVGRLNRILGPNSPQMQGLRAEVLSDIVSPLLNATPDVAAFLKNYDDFIAKNPTLKRELFPGGLEKFDSLARFSREVAKRPGATIKPEQAVGIWGAALNGLTRYAFGHGIAQGGVRVKAATGLVNRLRDATMGRAARRQILLEYLGADPKRPFFIPGTGTTTGAAGVQQARERSQVGVE